MPVSHTEALPLFLAHCEPLAQLARLLYVKNGLWRCYRDLYFDDQVTGDLEDS